MKRIFCALLVLTMLAGSLLAFSSCGPKKEDVPNNTKWELTDIQNMKKDGEAVDSVLESTVYEVIKRAYGEYTCKKDSKGYVTDTKFWPDRIEFKDGKVYYHNVVGKDEGEEYNSATVYGLVEWVAEEKGTYEGKEITLDLTSCKEIYFTDGKLIMEIELKTGGGAILTAELVFEKVGALL